MTDDANSPLTLAAVNRQLITWIEDLLGIDGVTLDDDLLALGADSITFATVLRRLYDELGVDIPMDRFFTATRIGELIDATALAGPAQPRGGTQQG